MNRLGGPLLTLLFPAAALILGVRMLPFLLMPALMLLPGFVCRGEDSPPGRSDSDGGSGDGPPPPPDSPDVPRGDLPLPDAEPARVRLRDHGGPDRTQPRERRPAREADPAPLRSSY